MAVPAIFQTIEESGLSTWIRDSPSIFAFWFILSFHAIGMGLVAGASLIVDLRVLGFARDLPLSPMKSLYRIMWIGFWIQVVSGALLLIAYPTKTLMNPDFYVKLAFIALAVVVMQKLKRRVFVEGTLDEAALMARGKALAVWSLFLWLGAVTAGRLLAYTYTYLKYSG